MKYHYKSNTFIVLHSGSKLTICLDGRYATTTHFLQRRVIVRVTCRGLWTYRADFGGRIRCLTEVFTTWQRCIVVLIPPRSPSSSSHWPCPRVRLPRTRITRDGCAGRRCRRRSLKCACDTCGIPGCPRNRSCGR